MSEIIQPLIQGQPQPLTDTVPPQELGDPDSQWIRVEGVNLHYKDYGPKAPGVPVVLLLHGFNGSVFSWCSPYLRPSNGGATLCFKLASECMGHSHHGSLYA